MSFSFAIIYLASKSNNKLRLDIKPEPKALEKNKKEWLTTVSHAVKTLQVNR